MGEWDEPTRDETPAAEAGAEIVDCEVEELEVDGPETAPAPLPAAPTPGFAPPPSPASFQPTRSAPQPLASPPGGPPPPHRPQVAGGGYYAPPQPLPPGMAQCQVTGRILPADDVVMFQGRLVSAEGKQVLLRHLMGGVARALPLERPSFLRRLLCWLLDFAIRTIIVIPAVTVLYVAFLPYIMALLDTERVNFLGSFIGSGFAFAYYALFHGLWGKTLGKMAGGFRVVNMDGSAITMRTAVLRAFFSHGIFAISAAVGMFAFFPGLILSVLSTFYMLANIVSLPVDSLRNRALHDRIAGTKVIMDE